MIQINSEVLKQFDKEGLSINEGIAVDARLIKSASRPMSNDDIKKHRDKRNSPEGKFDKNGNPLKFHRDLDSNWVVQKDIIHYGLKEHAAVDVNHGFILATTLTPASVNDTNYLPYCTVYSRHTKQPIEKVFADKGYAGNPNRKFLALNNIEDGIMRKDTQTAKLTEYEIDRNKKISKKTLHRRTILWPESFTRRCQTSKIYRHHEKQIRLLVPSGGIQYLKGA